MTLRVSGGRTEQLFLHEKSIHKTPSHESENHTEVDNEHGFNEANATAAKKSRKKMVDVGSDEELNRSKAGISQSTC